MNKAEKLIQKRFLNDEEAIIRRLKTVYNQSHKDITGKISKLDMSIGELQKAYADIGDEIGPLAGAVLKRAGNLTPEQAKETIQSMIQSKVYQKQYQEALKSQIDGTLDKLLDKQYTAVSDYLNECYENAFVGTMMNFQSQGIPLIMPIDQEAMVRAVQLDSPIKEGLYKHLGEDVGLLKRRITAEVSRGISTGMTYSQVAEQLARKMMGTYENPGGSLAYATRIARTEGHRIQCQSAMDACYGAKDKGADVVKQWDSTLDGRTRESHQAVDGEIRELDKKFSNGLMYPGDPAGGAAEVVNCRCALLQRAKWALDEGELETLKERAAFFGLDKTGNFEDYKKKYLKAAEGLTNSVKSDIIRQADIYIGKSVGAKSQNYDILDFDTGEFFRLAEGTHIHKVEVFAGKGVKSSFRKAQKYADKYGGDASNWQHVKGEGVLSTPDGDRKANIHWVQCEGVGRFDFFVKEWLE